MDTDLDERRGLPSASAWRRNELCSASHQLSQEAKRLGQEAYKDSPDARSGKRGHASMAGEAVELDETEKTSVAFMRERADDQVTRIFGDSPVQEFKERRLWLYVGGKPVASGRVDRFIIGGKVALIQDYKFGFREPDPAQINAQLKFLSVVLALAYPQVHHVIAQIVSGPYGVTEARYDYRELEAAYGDIRATLRAINDPHATFSPGPEQCRFCPAQLICQPFRDATVAPISKLQITQLPVEPNRASKLLDEVEMLRRLCDQVEEFYSEKLLTDPSFSIPNYAMVPGAVRREVTDWDAARGRLGEYLDTDQIKGAANYRLGELEKALAKVLKLKGKDAKQRMNEILHGLIIERPNSPSLKRIKGVLSQTDPRQSNAQVVSE